MAEGLTLRALRIMHGDRPLLELDLTVPPATILSVMGPSGVGKSTLLAAITGQMSADFSLEGEILLNGRDLCPLPPQERRVGILFQDHLLFPHLSVGANLAFGLAPRVRGRARRTRIKDALVEIGLEGFHDRDPETLSGGQKARVALMRMLLSEPDLLLLDEPFSQLDATLRDQMRDLVFTFARDRALPVLMVTHDAADAEAAGGPIVQLEP
ncbi:ATP-binding cassette domain-containing protein [Tritonibacter mobilis]|uniref:ATP-binding cassette domain-containing protein n=1 Tax=Tritonibacter mobilis TaxID=379347 RepID=UPI000806D2CB|nr:ATP-binding cassette domain-containing protein [Tritonibacter mobilis]